MYIRQKKGYGIGNFINLTPAIQTLYKIRGQKIKVLFEQPEIEKLFEGWEIIEPIKKHSGELILCSSMINQDIPDWLFNHKRIEKIFNCSGTVPHTFTPSYNLCESTNHIVLIRGMVNDSWQHKKDPGDKIYFQIIDEICSKGFPIAFIGSSADFQRTHDRMIQYIKKNWPETKIIQSKDNIQESASIVEKALLVISNDTGFYHVAASYNKKQFILWKNTNFLKNKAPGINNIFASLEYWDINFKTWFNYEITKL